MPVGASRGWRGCGLGFGANRARHGRQHERRVEAKTLPHGQETQAREETGYQGADKRPDAKSSVRWHIAISLGKHKLLGRSCLVEELTEQLERIRASTRAKVEHPFSRVIKHQFRRVNMRYWSLAKNTAQLVTLLTLSNLWMVRRSLLGAKA